MQAFILEVWKYPLLYNIPDNIYFKTQHTDNGGVDLFLGKNIVFAPNRMIVNSEASINNYSLL